MLFVASLKNKSCYLFLYTLFLPPMINLKKKPIKHIKGYETIDGWLTENEALGLYHIASKCPSNALVVEIGSWKGKSTFCIAKGLKKGKVIAIDPFNGDASNDEGSRNEYNEKKGGDDLLRIFINNMEAGKLMDKIIIKKGYSQQFADEISAIDFLFIDGDHSIEGCKADYEMYASKIKPGGFLAFHDYYENRKELRPTFVIQNIISKSGEFIFSGQFDTLWVAKKN